MKFNPLALAEQQGDSEFALTRIETTCARNPFICAFWTWFPLAVTLQSFLSTRDRAILSRTNSVICLDSTEVSLALTEKRESISVDSWEVPTLGDGGSSFVPESIVVLQMFCFMKC